MVNIKSITFLVMKRRCVEAQSPYAGSLRVALRIPFIFFLFSSPLELGAPISLE